MGYAAHAMGEADAPVHQRYVNGKRPAMFANKYQKP